MASSMPLYGVTSIGQALLSEQLEENVRAYFEWGFLGIGAFVNVSLPASGAFGGTPSRLRLVDDPNYTRGCVWETYRKNLIWESGVPYSTQPIQISGVYVNNTFRAKNSVGTYAHHVEYPTGRVVFDSPIPTTSVVQAEYSYKLFSFEGADTPWWREFQTNSFRLDSPDFAAGSGMWGILAQNRVQLPAVIVEASPTTSRKGLELGGYAAVVRQDVLLHVVTETPWDRKSAHDIITQQYAQRTLMYDKNLVYASGVYPLEMWGQLRAGALTYPDLIRPRAEGGYAWRQVRFEDVRSVAQPREVTAPLYYTTIRLTCEIDI